MRIHSSSPMQPDNFELHHPFLMNKRFILLLLVASAAFSTRCNKNDDLTPGVDLVYREYFEIPAGIGIFDVHHFYISNIPSRFETTLAQAGKTPDDIKGVITVEASISGQNGDANLSYIDRISLRAFDPNNINDYLELAYRDPAPADPGNAMGLIPTLSDSKPYFNANRVGLDVAIWLRHTTPDNTPMQVDLKVRATY